jgi:drug/metabolite transporter (DMT)-like permease
MKLDRGVAAGLLVVLLWASAFPAIRVAAPAMGSIGLSFVRLAVALVALATLAALQRIRLPRRADLGWILAAGFFGMAAYQLLLNESELTVPAGTASIIVSAAPLVSISVAWVLYRERITAMTVVGSAIALAGVALVCLARAGLSWSSSVWLVIGAMVVQGVYHPLQRPLMRTRTALEVATYTMLAGTLMTLPALGHGWAQLTAAPVSGWIAAIYLGLLPSALGFWLWAYAAGRLPVAVSTSLLYLVPPVAVVIAWVWLAELPTAPELAGGLVVIAGVLVILQGPRLAHRLRDARRPGGRRTRRPGSGVVTADDVPRSGEVVVPR